MKGLLFLQPGCFPAIFMSLTTPLFQRERMIRFSDCDPAGIVFYPQYFIMFNGLIEDWFNEGLKVGYRRTLIARRIGVPTVKIEAEFKAISNMGDPVRLMLDVERLGGRSLTLLMRCVGKDDGVLRMSIRQVLVTTDLNTHKAIAIPEDIRMAIEQSVRLPQDAIQTAQT